MFSNDAAGAFSLKSTVSYSPSEVLSAKNPPPPTPLWCMFVTPTQKTVPTRASTAFPPSRRIWMPKSLQTSFSEATPPRRGFVALQGTAAVRVDKERRERRKRIERRILGGLEFGDEPEGEEEVDWVLKLGSTALLLCLTRYQLEQRGG